MTNQERAAAIAHKATVLVDKIYTAANTKTASLASGQHSARKKKGKKKRGKKNSTHDQIPKKLHALQAAKERILNLEYLIRYEMQYIKFLEDADFARIEHFLEQFETPSEAKLEQATTDLIDLENNLSRFYSHAQNKFVRHPQLPHSGGKQLIVLKDPGKYRRDLKELNIPNIRANHEFLIGQMQTADRESPYLNFSGQIFDLPEDKVIQLRLPTCLSKRPGTTYKTAPRPYTATADATSGALFGAATSAPVGIPLSIKHSQTHYRQARVDGAPLQTAYSRAEAAYAAIQDGLQCCMQGITALKDTIITDDPMSIDYTESYTLLFQVKHPYRIDFAGRGIFRENMEPSSLIKVVALLKQAYYETLQYRILEYLQYFFTRDLEIDSKYCKFWQDGEADEAGNEIIISACIGNLGGLKLSADTISKKFTKFKTRLKVHDEIQELFAKLAMCKPEEEKSIWDGGSRTTQAEAAASAEVGATREDYLSVREQCRASLELLAKAKLHITPTQAALERARQLEIEETKKAVAEKARQPASGEAEESAAARARRLETEETKEAVEDGAKQLASGEAEAAAAHIRSPASVATPGIFGCGAAATPEQEEESKHWPGYPTACSGKQRL